MNEECNKLKEDNRKYIVTHNLLESTPEGPVKFEFFRQNIFSKPKFKITLSLTNFLKNLLHLRITKKANACYFRHKKHQKTSKQF